MHRPGEDRLKPGAAMAAAGVLLLAVLAPPVAAQSAGDEVSCSGALPDDWTYAAHAVDGRFLHIIWTGPAGQTRVSPMSYLSTNADGSPVFGGTLQDTIIVTLVDASGGAPATGTEIVIHSEQYGWFPATCQTLEDATPYGVISAEVIRQNLIGTRDTTATNWLRRNDFTLVRTTSGSGDIRIERWQQDPSYPVDVFYSGSIVSDVLPAAP